MQLVTLRLRPRKNILVGKDTKMFNNGCISSLCQQCLLKNILLKINILYFLWKRSSANQIARKTPA